MNRTLHITARDLQPGDVIENVFDPDGTAPAFQVSRDVVDEPNWTIISVGGGGGDDPSVFHIRTPWGWCLLGDNARGWTPAPGYRVVHYLIEAP